MKLKALFPLLLTLPILVGCGKDKEEPNQPEPKKDLEIPTVDVDSITPNLPTRPTYNVGEILNDDTYDYFDFYELSDMHGAVNEDSSKIGLAKLSSYLENKRKENLGGTFVVSSGDMFQGSAESNLTRGYMVNYAMNYMGFDSMAIGNHEFDWTDSWLKKNSELSYNGVKIPYISANIVKAGTNEIPDFISKSVTYSRGDYKIGIIGSIDETLKSSILASCVEGYEFTKELDAVNEEAARLKNEGGCDIVVLTSHNSLDNLKSGLSNDIDAVFGGHAHENDDSYINATIPAVQTENYGQSIAHIQLKIDKTTKEVSCSKKELDEHPLSLPGLVADQNVLSIMNNYSEGINNIKNIKLGTADKLLKNDGALKGICTESMYQGALKGIKDLNLGIAESDILATFHNVNGGIRSNIEQGEITIGDVYNPFPFDNEIVLYKLSGEKFKGRLVKYGAYATRRTFKSVDDIDESKDYYLVLTDFIALSQKYFGSVFDIEEDQLIRTGKVVRDEVANFIYKTDSIVGDNYLSNKEPYKTIK